MSRQNHLVLPYLVASSGINSPGIGGKIVKNDEQLHLGEMPQASNSFITLTTSDNSAIGREETSDTIVENFRSRHLPLSPKVPSTLNSPPLQFEPRPKLLPDAN